MDTTLIHSDHRELPRAVDSGDWPMRVGVLWLRASLQNIRKGWAAWWSDPQRTAAAQVRICAGLLLATAVLGMLLAFHQVVRGVVQQSESRRQAAAALAAATWRCNALRSVDGARKCLAGLEAPSDSVQAALAPRQMPTGQVQPAVLPALALLSDGAGTRPSPQSRSRITRSATPRGMPESTE